MAPKLQNCTSFVPGLKREPQVERRNRASRHVMRGYDKCRGQAAPAT